MNDLLERSSDQQEVSEAECEAFSTLRKQDRTVQAATLTSFKVDDIGPPTSPFNISIFEIFYPHFAQAIGRRRSAEFEAEVKKAFSAYITTLRRARRERALPTLQLQLAAQKGRRYSRRRTVRGF